MSTDNIPVDPSLYKLAIDETRHYALFFLDPRGYVITWNAGAERIKGYKPSEIIGRHFSTFYTRDAVESGWPAHELKVASMEGRFEDEGWRVRKDGSRFWANVVINALRDTKGKLIAFYKITRDLSDRKIQEEALRHSEERFRLMVEGVTDYAIYMLDPEGIVTSWNSGAATIKGYTAGEIVGKHFSRFYNAEDIEAGKPWEELSIARRVGRAESEGWRVKKDGSRFWARVVVTALRDSDGMLRGFAKVTQDLTARRHMQDLESATKNINEFIGVLAHEIRNPLAPIRMAVRVMADAPRDDAIQDAMRDTIDRQSAHLSRMVDDMLDIARLTRGTLIVQNQLVDLHDIVRNALETARPLIEEKRHHVHVELADAPIMVMGDADRLTQMLANLVNNAARYTQDEGNIWIRAREEEGYAKLCVLDDGCGIVPEMIEPIFGMFVQGRSPLQRVGGGLGIGLALARRIAELHGGSLEASSEGENKGSQFAVKMPLADAATLAASRQNLRPPTPAAKVYESLRVLVVDDNADAATALGMLLKSLGHDTRIANDGFQALDIAAEFHPDIVLLDIGMPGLDGYEVAKRLRAADGSRAVRIIAVTGWGQDADREKSYAAGIDVHLVKPVDTNDLTRALNDRNGSTLH